MEKLLQFSKFMQRQYLGIVSILFRGVLIACINRISDEILAWLIDNVYDRSILINDNTVECCLLAGGCVLKTLQRWGWGCRVGKGGGMMAFGGVGVGQRINKSQGGDN